MWSDYALAIYELTEYRACLLIEALPIDRPNVFHIPEHLTNVYP